MYIASCNAWLVFRDVMNNVVLTKPHFRYPHLIHVCVCVCVFKLYGWTHLLICLEYKQIIIILRHFLMMFNYIFFFFLIVIAFKTIEAMLNTSFPLKSGDHLGQGDRYISFSSTSCGGIHVTPNYVTILHQESLKSHSYPLWLFRPSLDKFVLN